MTTERPITILALASEYKGIPFLQECKRQGCHVIVLVTAEHKDQPWPHEAIDEFFDMPDVRTQPDLTYAVSFLARDRRIDRIMALDDYDVEHAADLREHLRLEGMGHTAARLFRDKLAMRTHAKKNGIKVPEFVGIFNYDDIRAFMGQANPPWVFKPRMLAGSEGIRKLEDGEQLWRLLDEMGDQKSYYLLEQFIEGDVFHVDALVWDGEVVFSLVSQYGTPPMATFHGRKVFTTRVLPRDAEDAVALRAFNEQLVKTMGRTYGPTHTEFIKAADGTFYFLETAARVAGGNIEKLIEAATGLVIWQEAARMEIADIRGEAYTLPELREEYGGLIACFSNSEYADTSAYNDPEVMFRPRAKKFASLVVGSPSYERVEELLAQYAERFVQDFMS
ncbi:MAG: ATP-grasp domain-containing protein [Anaerolineales bacterium]|nr:ATP-grasp domain-containing protein [Anaerolineales bacterium]